MRLVGNLVWLLFGGLFMAIAYVLAGLIMFIFVITIPFGIQAFKLAAFSAWPFGSSIVKRADAGAGALIGNLLWVVLAGWWIAVGHLLSALFSAVTIIGIPFAIAHLKLAVIAFWPFGRMVVPRGEAASGDLVIA